MSARAAYVFVLLPLFTGYFAAFTLLCISICSFTIVKGRNLWIIEPADGTFSELFPFILFIVVAFLFLQLLYSPVSLLGLVL